MHVAKAFPCKTSIVLWLWITLWDEHWYHENELESNWGAVKVANWLISIDFNRLAAVIV